MWRITFSIDYYYYSESNRISSDTVDSAFVDGDTVDVAIKNLCHYLKGEGYLESIIDTNAGGSKTKNSYNNLHIIGIDKVIESKSINIMNHPIFLDLIEPRKAEILEHEKKIISQKKRNEKARELAQLKKLKEKYED